MAQVRTPDEGTNHCNKHHRVLFARRSIALLVVFILCTFALQAQDSLHIYLFPGQGSDARVFAGLQFPDNVQVHTLSYPVPARGERMPAFARRLTPQIDTTQTLVFIGHSLGGMLATELADSLQPRQLILISSAKCRYELPLRYRWLRWVPLHRILPKRLIKAGALIAQPLVEPDRNTHKATFKAMLKAKDPAYLKRTIDMIVRWKRTTCAEATAHLHGSHDHTLPARHVTADQLLPGGSHMMVLTRSTEVNAWVQKQFKLAGDEW